MDNLTGMTIFVRTVELGSQAAAAADLGLSRMAVGRHIGKLEHQLGVQLLQRTTRRQTLTEAGSVLFEQARPALQQLRDATEMAADLRTSLHGTIRINAPISFAAHSLTDVLVAFSRDYPDIAFDLVLDDKQVDVVGGGFDLVLRIGKMRDSSLVSRRLARFPSKVCAAPAYLDRHGRPEAPADLAGHNCLRYAYSSQMQGWELACEDGSTITVPARGNMTATNGDVLTAAALAGQGVILQPSFLVDRHLAEGTLVDLFPGQALRWLELYAVFPPSQMMPGKLRRLIDFLTKAYRETPAGAP